MGKKELQVKSKERVKDFGEALANPREVRFLEPTCGNRDFLIEMLAIGSHLTFKNLRLLDV